MLLALYRTFGTLFYCWNCTLLLVLYRSLGTVPYSCYCTTLLVLYHTLGTIPYSWYCTNCWYCTVLLVLYHSVVSVRHSWYCTLLLVLYHTFVTVPHSWYCTLLLFLYHTLSTVPYTLCTVNLAPCHTPIWPLASALNARDSVGTRMDFILEACVLLTYLLTPWCRFLLEKLTGLQLVKKFPAVHGTRKFITALTSVRHLDHLTTLETCFSTILAVTLGCNSHQLEHGARDRCPDATIKLLNILRSSTFDLQLIPQPLLTARLGLGIQQFWPTECHLVRFLSEYFDFTLPVSLCQYSILVCHLYYWRCKH